MWHGQADPAVSVDRTIQYHRDVTNTMGNTVDSFYRLFLPEGVKHCNNPAAGANTFDALSALENWVERGQPPEYKWDQLWHASPKPKDMRVSDGGGLQGGRCQ